MKDTRVTLNGEQIYDARLDPTNRWNGWVSPQFTLDTVRQLAADTQADAATYGHDAVDTIHVIEGGTDDEDEPRVIVLHIRWQSTTTAQVLHRRLGMDLVHGRRGRRRIATAGARPANSSGGPDAYPRPALQWLCGGPAAVRRSGPLARLAQPPDLPKPQTQRGHRERFHAGAVTCFQHNGQP